MNNDFNIENKIYSLANITGHMKEIIEDYMYDHHCKKVTAVTKKVDLLIINRDKETTSKEKKAIEFNNENEKQIIILDCYDFLFQHNLMKEYIYSIEPTYISFGNYYNISNTFRALMNRYVEGNYGRIEKLNQYFNMFKELKIKVIYDYLKSNKQEIKCFNEEELINLAKRNKHVLETIIDNDDTVALDNYLSLYKNINLSKIDDLMNKAENKAMIKAYLLSYKENNFTSKQIEKYEKMQEDKAFGLRELSIADWRKIFKFHYENGDIVITKYIGNDKNVVIPSKIGKRKVTIISYGAFRHSDITSVIIPETVDLIDMYAFSGCSYLNNVIIPKTTSLVGLFAFYRCERLTNITLSRKVDRIEEFQFENCSSLQVIEIPENIKIIEYGAFIGCNNLQQVIIHNRNIKINTNAFNNYQEIEFIYK